MIKHAHQIDIYDFFVFYKDNREWVIYELYRDRIDLSENFIIRAKANRSIHKMKRRGAPKEKFFDLLEESKNQHKLKKNRKFRPENLSLIYKKISISPQ